MEFTVLNSQKGFGDIFQISHSFLSFTKLKHPKSPALGIDALSPCICMAQCLAHSHTFSHVCYGCIYFHKLELLQEADKRGMKGMIPQFIGSCHVDEKLSVSFRIQNGNLPFFVLQLREFHYHHPIHFCDLKCHSTSVYHLTWG